MISVHDPPDWQSVEREILDGRKGGGEEGLKEVKGWDE